VKSNASAVCTTTYGGQLLLDVGEWRCVDMNACPLSFWR
jgi:hypothetical protein